MTLFLFILVSALLVLFVSGVYTFCVACARRKDVNWLIEEEVKKTPYKNYYSIILDAKRWLDDHGAQDIYIISDDGLKLHALWVPVQNPKGTILLAHGYRSTMLVDFGSVLEIYHRLGFQLILPDQRSHGQSEGRFITFGVKESGDMLGWIDYHNHNFGEHPMILSGLSMGASTMMYLADQKLPNNVKGMIVDCGFTSPMEIISSVFRSVTHLPAAPTIYMTELFARSVAGFSLWQKDSRKTLSKNKLPILMIHGREDTFVPCKMTEEGYQACTGPKRLLIVDGAEHGVSFLVDTKTYIETVMSFLRDNLEDFEVNYATIKNCDIANGPGVRVSLFVSGCTHHCKGCFNEIAWDFGYGEPFTQKTIDLILEMLKPAHIQGLTLLGGEPFEPQNQPAVVELLRQIKEKYPEKSIWAFSGYLFDRDILEGKLGSWEITREYLGYLDVLVDGPFIEDKKDLSLRFRGSSNQRIIDVPASLKENQVVLWSDWQGNERGLK